MPLVSVIMGVYCKASNCVRLERAITSILSQSMSDIEFLICDDGSDQTVCAFLDRLASQDHRVLLLRPGNLISLPKKLNHCLSHASGRLIARMDDDDVSHPDRLQRQVDYLLEHPEIDFVGCNVNRISAEGTISTLFLPHQPIPKDFFFAMPFIHPTLMFRHQALTAAQGYCEKDYCLLCEDYDLLLRLYSLGMQGANLDEILFDYSMAGVEQKRRKYRFRINEAVVRFLRFRALGLFPGAFPYVIKPLIVGILPTPLINWLRKKRDYRKGRTL